MLPFEMKQDPAAFNFPISCHLDLASVSLLYASQQKLSFLLQKSLSGTALGPLPNQTFMPSHHPAFRYLSPPAFFL